MMQYRRSGIFVSNFIIFYSIQSFHCVIYGSDTCTEIPDILHVLLACSLKEKRTLCIAKH